MALVAGALSAVPAFAGGRSPKAEAKAEVAKAQMHYKLGRFEDALAAYTKAYELFNAPALLFNIGQCHKNLKNYERAIFFFEGYLREEPNPNPAKRTLAEQLIESSRAELARQRNAPTPLVSPPVVAPPPPPSPPSGADAIDGGVPEPLPHPAPIPEAFPPPPPPMVDQGATPTPVTERWWFWTAIGAGVLAVVGGTVAYYATGTTKMVPPDGTIGTLDRR